MKRKIAFLFSLLMVLTFALTACGNKEAEMKKEDTAMETKEDTKVEEAKAETPDKVFTLEELAKYNGKDGEKAYVAIDGVVYDLTGLAGWKEGMHNGFEAGKDLTEEMKKAPHGTAKLKGLPVVGTLEAK